MKITDMNLICLEECFEYLEYADLLSVANSNTRLRRAAQFVYFRKPDQNCLTIYPPNSTKIRRSLEFLRCFGNLISSLKLYAFEKDELLFSHLNEYCAEYLTKIHLDFTRECSMKELKRPFSKVREVYMNMCDTQRMSSFNKIFPKMRRLLFITTEKSKVDCVVDHFPYLEELDISFDPSKRQHVLSSLRLNPQLKSLHLSTYIDDGLTIDEDTLQDAIESMHNLEVLTLRLIRFNNFHNKYISLKSLKKFHISVNNCNQLKFLFLFDKLECLNMNLSCANLLSENFYNFIGRHSHIKELKIRISSFILFDFDLSRLWKVLPLLENLRLYGFRLSVDDVLRLLSKLKSLKIFEFDASDTSLYDELRVRLPNEWRVTIKRNIFRLERSSQLANK